VLPPCSSKKCSELHAECAAVGAAPLKPLGDNDTRWNSLMQPVRNFVCLLPPLLCMYADDRHAADSLYDRLTNLQLHLALLTLRPLLEECQVCGWVGVPRGCVG
jgi:hypothetical protein